MPAGRSSQDATQGNRNTDHSRSPRRHVTHFRGNCKNAQHETGQDDTVALTVSDTGLSIAPEKLATIFEPFVQLKEGLADRKGGIGLGLSISRDLARAMNGDLTVESTEGKGTRFTLSLPRTEKGERLNSTT